LRAPFFVCTTAGAVLCITGLARADVITVVDVIPNAASNETGQNSEPSLAVDPLDPTQMVSGSFPGSSGPFWKSTDGGTTWSSFGGISNSDKSLAWRQDGVAPLAATLTVISNPPLVDNISTFQGGASNFGSAVFTTPNAALDQPWIRTGPGGQTYVALNHLGNAGGQTASMGVGSTNAAGPFTTVKLETVNPAGGQDAPSVRQAVNGSTVYAAFTRWGTGTAVTGGSIFSASQVVVVKSTNAGATFSGGVSAASTTGYFSTSNTAQNTPLSLGQERISSDLAIAVDPNNANRVVVAYGDRTGAGVVQLKVVESTDGGATWSAPKFTTPTNVRSALPALSILTNGDVGLLYATYTPGGAIPDATGTLSQHLLTTTNDFATTTDTLLGTETNTTPGIVFNPYVGDFYDMTSVDDTFYGIFSASNDDNGTDALFASVSFQRCFAGAPGTASFALEGITGGVCDPLIHPDPSIDPFVFSLSLAVVTTPEPATLTLLGASLLGFAALRRRRT
jgi:hypothetical protein